VSVADDLGALLREYIEFGRESAVEDLVARTRPRLLAVARKIGAAQDAEDAVQAAYLALVRRRDPLDAPVLPWLLRTVIRIAYRRKAIERRQHALAGRLELPLEGPSAAAAAMSTEERARVRGEIDRLPERYRDVLVLHYLEDLATPEIAALQDLPESTVRTRLRRGRELLRGPLAPVWTYGLLAVPWFVRDAAAATGGLVVKKKAVLAGAVLLLALAGGVAVMSTASAPTSGTRGARQAPQARNAEPAPGPERAAEATEPVREVPSATGIVLDSGGRPVCDALVRVEAAQGEARPQPFRALFEGEASGGPGARSGTDGTFRVGLSAEAALVVEARGHSPACVAGVRPGDHVVVKLESAPSLSGAVRDLAGSPVPGAKVAWWVLAQGVGVERRGVSDESGIYRIDDLPSPRSWAIEGHACYVAVRAEGFAPVVTEAPRLWRGGGEELQFDVWLTRGSVIEGRVIDVETREPLPGASVALYGIFYGRAVVYEEARADAQGLFAFRSFPVDGFHAAPSATPERIMGWIRAEAEDRAPSTIDVPAIEGGRTLAVEVCCWPTATVRGRVVDGDGRPVEGANVSGFRNLKPLPSYLDSGATSPWARTDADGAFAWTGVPALRREASPMHLHAHREGWPVQQTRVEVRAGETTTVPDFVFAGPSQPSVIAEVVDETGAPVRGASVGVNPAVGTGTGPDGRARLFIYAVRECRLAARSRQSGICLSAAFLPSVEDPPVVRVVLDATHAVEGRVENAGGAPVVVSARRGEEALGYAKADAAGWFRLERLPAGAVDLVALAAGREGRTNGVPVDTSTAVVALPRAPVVRTVALEGTVKDAATGENVPRFTATLKGATRLQAERTAPGRFRFDAVPEGRFTLVVAAAGYGAHNQALDVAADLPPAPLDIALRGGVTVTGTIDNRAGVNELAVAFLDDRGVVIKHARVKGWGRYRIEDLRPGRCWLAVHAHGSVLSPDPSELVVPEGVAEIGLDFAVVAAGTLALLRADGAGRIEVADATGKTVWLRLDPSGDVSVNMTPGEYTVNGRRAEVSAGRVTEVDLGR